MLIKNDHCVVGADAGKYAASLNQSAYLGLKLRKHPLAVASVAAIAKPLTWIGVVPAVAGSIALALIQALGAVFFFAFLRRHFLNDVRALAVTILFLSTFSTITVFSVVETYGVTFAAAALVLLVSGELAPIAGTAPLAAALLAGAVGALAGWSNPPAVVFILAYPGLVWPKLGGSPARKMVLAVIVPVGISLSLTLLPTVLIDAGQDFVWQIKYIEYYATFAHFTNLRVIGDFLPTFFIFPFVAPLDHVLCRFTAGDIDLMRASLLRLGAWAVTVGLVAAGIGQALRRSSSRPFCLAMLGVTGALFACYLYFNPDEALLYSPQWVMALTAASAAGLASGRVTTAILGIAIALCLLVNISPLHDPRTASPASCCPVPPENRPDFANDRYEKAHGKQLDP